MTAATDQEGGAVSGERAIGDSAHPLRRDGSGRARVLPRQSRPSPESTSDLMVEFYVMPWNGPDGRKTWCVRKFVYGPDRYERHVVSWHSTREEAQITTRSERLISRYVLTLDFKSGSRLWSNAERFIHADTDAEAVQKARDIIESEARERRGGWTPIEQSARLVSVVTLTEPVEMEPSDA